MTRPDVLPIRSGAYLLHKSTVPRTRHDSFSAAEAEAIRLVEANPTATFIITREEARVRMPRSTSGIPLTRRQA